MGKFSGASAVQQAQEGKLGGIDLPIQQQPTQEPTTPQRGGGLLDSLRSVAAEDTAPAASEVVEPTQAALTEGFDQLLGEQTAEVERQRIPSLRERSVSQEIQRWEPTKVSSQSVDNYDGGMAARAKAMATNAKVLPSVSVTKPTEPDGILGNEIQEGGDLGSALNRVGAVVASPDGKGLTASPDFMVAGSLVAENFFAEGAFGTPEDVGGDVQSDLTLGQEPTVQREKLDPTKAQIKRSAQNARLGEQIYQEYQRLRDPNTTPAPLNNKKQAETIATAFKDLWWQNNPDLIKRFPDNNGAYVYQLTALGADALSKAQPYRKKLFPGRNVKPAKQKPPSGRLQGDVGNQVKNVLGAVGKPQFEKVLQDAVFNMSQIPNVVDKQRAKILYMTILPVLAGQVAPDGWEATINNMGKKQINKFLAKQATENQKGVAYDANKELADLQTKIANELRALATERNGANYYTYAIQAFNGRISPQQGHFNGTTSKAVRFATRNATPSIAQTKYPDERVHKNLRQMYAMMLVKDADLALPNEREIKLQGAEAQLRQWGTILRDKVTMTDEQYETLSQAIEQGQPLNEFPEIPQLDLSDNPELAAAIEAKGEDGPHFIDGLMDFANYADAKDQGKPYASYFNAYIDGKTNGLAAAAMQVGSSKTAYLTGVLRNGEKDLLDVGDIRVELRNILLDSLESGFGDVGDFAGDFNVVAKETFAQKSLNKQTTMVFGYGREAENFHEEIGETVNELYQTYQGNPDKADFIQAVDNLREFKDGLEGASKVLRDKYKPALEQVLSKEAIRVRSLMRGAAQLHAATNSLFTITSPIGADINLGGAVQATEAESQTKFSLFDTEAGRSTREAVSHYEAIPTAAAERAEESGVGSRAYGGSIPGPIQSIDAATVAMTVTGDSWKKLKAKSRGNPYVHSIYDAFKMDANGYDTILEETNKNWMDATLDWSAIDEMHKSTAAMMKEWNSKMAGRDPNSAVSPLESSFMRWITQVNDDGKMQQYNSRIRKLAKPELDPNQLTQQMQKTLASVGYSVKNPPAEVTVKQLKAFVGEFAKQMDLNRRMSSASSVLNKNKRELASEIKQKGYRAADGKMIPLQYYAH